jgi:hypothetical protein
MSCGSGAEVLYVIELFSTIIDQLLVEQKRAIANSGTWSVLIHLLNCQNDEVVKRTRTIMKNLVENRSGEDYARFIEDGLFEHAGAASNRFPDLLPHVLITVMGPFPLPDCCALLVMMLNKWARSKDWVAIGAFKMLTSLAYSRGLDQLLFIRFIESCSFALVLVQETTNCY